MANPKKGALAQFMVVMVDATDFASVESAITESDFNSGVTKKFYGVDHGVSTAFTSGTISKTGRLVRSGVFQITLKGTENNYDRMQIRLSKTGCAEQIIEWNNETNDDSDIMSALTVIQSMASDAASAAVQANSRVLLNQSRISDMASMLTVMSDILSDFYSDFQSRVPKAVATNSQLSDLHSDLRSMLVSISAIASDTHSAATAGASRALLNQSRISDVYSMLSDFQSDFGSRVPKRVATDSQLSDMASDLKSAIAGITATLSASDISDIASNVWAHTVGVRVDSRILIIQSMTSDVRSQVSDLQSDFQSRVPKLVATNSQLSDLASDIKSAVGAITVSLDASNISDIASAVVAALPITSMVSDIYSLLSDLQSDFQSRVPKRVATDSQLSDLASDLRSMLVSISSIASDTHSAATAAASRALINQSRVSDIYSLLSDVQSDFQSRVPKRVATDSQLSDLASDLKSAMVFVQSQASDIYSLLSDVSSDLGVMSGIQSDIYSLLSDVQSTVQGIRVQKNTALANFEFVMVLSSDHVTGATGKTVTAERSIDGGAFAACANAVTEVANGVYKISLAAADLNGDVVMLKMSAADCDTTFIEIITQP